MNALYNCYCDGDSKLAENGRDCVPRKVLKCESGYEVQSGVCVDVDECQGDHGCGFNPVLVRCEYVICSGTVNWNQVAILRMSPRNHPNTSGRF